MSSVFSVHNLENPQGSAVKKIATEWSNGKIVHFRIPADGEIKPHANPGRVVVTVLEGSGVFQGGEGDISVKAGDVVVYEPGEVHGFKPVNGELKLQAIILS